MNSKPVQKRNRKVLFILLLVVLVMFGFGYAMVPLYNVMCKKLGLNGKTDGEVTAQTNIIDMSRTITVQFLANNNAHLPWRFYPMVTSIKVHPGQNTKVAYFAENESSKTMIVQAVPSVSPSFAAKHLKKTECFCFTQQSLKPRQTMEMPLLFHLDSDLPKNIKAVTLSYTLFDITNMKNGAAKLSNKTQGKLQ